MKRTVLAALAALAPALCRAAPLPPLHVEGERLVDDKGRAVILRGVNFGSWFILETYFYGVKFKDEREVWAKVDKRFGAAAAKQVRDAHRANWITAEDFLRVKQLGLNSVRVPFWDGLFDVPAEGWRWLDFAVDSCEAAGLYCVLDFHGVPGGQSDADHTGESGRNAYWGSPAARKAAAGIWTAVAARYRGRAAIAAFDLVNEPMGAPDTASIVASADELLAGVRAGDPDRVAIVEDGYKGLALFPAPSSSGWTNVMFSQHHYPTFGMSGPPDPYDAFFQNFFNTAFPESVRQAQRLKAPLYVGEWNVIHGGPGGKAGGRATRMFIDAMENLGWSWAIWTYKQAQPAGVSPDEMWSFYRNNRPADLPDFDKDSLDMILAKIRGLRTENMQLSGAMAAGVKPPATKRPAGLRLALPPSALAVPGAFGRP